MNILPQYNFQYDLKFGDLTYDYFLLTVVDRFCKNLKGNRIVLSLQFVFPKNLSGESQGIYWYETKSCTILFNASLKICTPKPAMQA